MRLISLLNKLSLLSVRTWAKGPGRTLMEWKYCETVLYHFFSYKDLSKSTARLPVCNYPCIITCYRKKIPSFFLFFEQFLLQNHFRYANFLNSLLWHIDLQNSRRAVAQPPKRTPNPTTKWSRLSLPPPVWYLLREGSSLNGPLEAYSLSVKWSMMPPAKRWCRFDIRASFQGRFFCGNWNIG